MNLFHASASSSRLPSLVDSFGVVLLMMFGGGGRDDKSNYEEGVKSPSSPFRNSNGNGTIHAYQRLNSEWIPRDFFPFLNFILKRKIEINSASSFHLSISPFSKLLIDIMRAEIWRNVKLFMTFPVRQRLRLSDGVLKPCKVVGARVSVEFVMSLEASWLLPGTFATRQPKANQRQ